MATDTIYDLRLEALRLAQTAQTTYGGTGYAPSKPDDVVARAKVYLSFLSTGESA